MSDEEAVAFGTVSRAEQRIRLALAGFNVSRLEFESWRVANGRDPEWTSSDRQPLSRQCLCDRCRSGLPAS